MFKLFGLFTCFTIQMQTIQILDFIFVSALFLITTRMVNLKLHEFTKIYICTTVTHTIMSCTSTHITIHHYILHTYKKQGKKQSLIVT